MASHRPQLTKVTVRGISTTDGGVQKFPVDVMPDEVLGAITNAQEEAEAAQSTANTAKTTAEAAQSTANTAKTTAEAAQSTADSAKSTAEAAQSTADSAKSTAEAALRIYQDSDTATKSIGTLSMFAGSSYKRDLGHLNIANGSEVSLVASGYDVATGIWNGFSINLWLNLLNSQISALVLLRMDPDGSYEIVNQSNATLSDLTLTYRKIAIPSSPVYAQTNGAAWLPPYLCTSALYLIGDKDGGSGFPIYKIAINKDGVLTATKVTT